jgi:hypothetical protein
MVATGIAGGPCCADAAAPRTASAALNPKTRKGRLRMKDASGIQVSNFDEASLAYRYRTAHGAVAKALAHFCRSAMNLL